MTETSCQSNNISNILESKEDTNSEVQSKVSTPSQILVRVKRRRSRSPAEALLLTNSLSQAKRSKTDHDDSTKENSKIKVFRFTATLDDKDKDSSTKELLTKVIEETSREIENVRAQKRQILKSDKRSIKNIRTSAQNSKYQETGGKQISTTLVDKSIKARYRVVESKRGLNDPNGANKSPSDTPNNKAEKELCSKEEISKSNSEVNCVNKELNNLYRLYDLELDDDSSFGQLRQDQSLSASSNLNKKGSLKNEDTIVCNGVRAEEIKDKTVDECKNDSEYVYDLYCHIDQDEAISSDSTAKATVNSSQTSEVQPDKCCSKTISEFQTIPDIHSYFEDAANIVGCDWKSAQDYLTSDLDDGMPDWWHRAGNTNYNSDFGHDDSDDSNAEDNWRNDYPDEFDGEDNEYDGYGFDNQNEETEDDIYGLDSLRIRDYGSSDDEGEDRLVYSLDDSKEYSDISNRHGSAYASYKRKMQRFLDNEDDFDEHELDDDSSDEYSDKDF